MHTGHMASVSPAPDNDGARSVSHVLANELNRNEQLRSMAVRDQEQVWLILQLLFFGL